MDEVEWETTSAVIRIRLAGTADNTFDYSMMVVGDEGVATIKALKGTMSRGVQVQVFDRLRAEGFKEVRWTRHRPNGTVQERRYSLVG